MILGSAGAETVRLPPWSPNLNAYAQRFVRSIKEECLERMMLIGERSLRWAASQFCEHYHRERNHQGLGNKVIEADFKSDGRGQVRCRQPG
jgi:putative transposase